MTAAHSGNPSRWSWSSSDRSAALSRAERSGVDILVVGGGITGAGVLRDAASRGLRALLVEREDFASGTSSRSSKMIHGGIRYIAQGQLRVTREACRERDLLLRQNPNLVRPLPFVFPAYEDSALPLWKVRAALSIYTALANFRRTARTRMLDPRELERLSSDMRTSGLRGAGLYVDAQVDDARLVLESIRSARQLGGEAVNHTEVTGFRCGDGGRIAGVELLDREGGGRWTIPVHCVVNAAGPSVERVRGLERSDASQELRPAKGVHLVIPRGRIRTQAAVVFDAPDGRHCFATPWDDVILIGTTDAFSDEIDEPVVRIEEVHYLLAAANAAFPRAALTTNDLRSVFAGVRPLAAPTDADTPPSSVSREDRLWADPSGMISVTGGKLTTYRAMGERIVDRALRQLPAARRAAAGPSCTSRLPLRDDDFDAATLAGELCGRFGVAAEQAAHLVRTYGADAEPLLDQAPAEWRTPIGASHFSYAEIPWSFRSECPSGLCDLLERRMRLALLAEGQGVRELDEIAAVAARCNDWDRDRTEAEIAAYTRSVRRRYQIAPPEVRSTSRTSRAA